MPINAMIYTTCLSRCLWLPGAHEGVQRCWLKLEVPNFTRFYNGTYKQIYYIYKLNTKTESYEVPGSVIVKGLYNTSVN